ncbi:16S rRNA (adenine(1518)-N(6)/adenine(1519)-N(6))-dimethyltransferaseRsmA [soil metagenome]
MNLEFPDTPRPNSPETVSATLKALGIRPTRGKGQNFLVSEQIVLKTVEAIDLDPNDYVVEIGPGFGIMTEYLVQRASKVVAIELDDRLAAFVQRSLSAPNLTVIHGDALKVPPDAFMPAAGPYHVAANLPYSVGSAIVRRFLEFADPPETLVVMLQKEVAKRMIARPPAMSLLGLGIQLYATGTIAFDVPPEAFKPRPKVESAVLVLKCRSAPLIPASCRGRFFDIARVAFQQRRKQLGNTLSTGMSLSKATTSDWLDRSGIRPEQRPETVPLEGWLALLREYPG